MSNVRVVVQVNDESTEAFQVPEDQLSPNCDPVRAALAWASVSHGRRVLRDAVAADLGPRPTAG